MFFFSIIILCYKNWKLKQKIHKHSAPTQSYVVTGETKNVLYNRQWKNGIVFVKNNKIIYQKLIAKINSVLQTITSFERGLLKYLNNYSRIDWENLSEFFK